MRKIDNKNNNLLLKLKDNLYWLEAINGLHIKDNLLSTKIVEIKKDFRVDKDFHDLAKGEMVSVGSYLLDLSYKSDLKSEKEIVLVNISYRKLEYTDTIYISYFSDKKEYCETIRLRQNQDITSPKIKSKILSIIQKVLDLKYTEIALNNWHEDNLSKEVVAIQCDKYRKKLRKKTVVAVL